MTKIKSIFCTGVAIANVLFVAYGIKQLYHYGQVNNHLDRKGKLEIKLDQCEKEELNLYETLTEFSHLQDSERGIDITELVSLEKTYSEKEKECQNLSAGLKEINNAYNKELNKAPIVKTLMQF